MAAVVLDRVSKRFGATVVADDLSLEIADGEFFVVLGPSGCGKSTLLHMIAGVEPPAAGRIRIGGADVTDLAPQKRDVAMVFQSYALYPHLDVAGNLAFPLRSRGMSRRAARAEVERVAAVLGLAPLLDRKPRELSGGQRQRVALGRALVRRPAAFLMDEPLSNLDAALRIEIREEIKRVHQTHRVTTVYVTHDQEEALALADRVAVLRDGRLRQCATPGAVFARPADVFVARFVGTPPMNLLPATGLADHRAVRARLAGRDPAGITVGLRPHSVDAHASPQPGALALDIALVEPAGAETWVVAGAGAMQMKGRLAPGAALAPGAVAHFTFAADAVHLFDATSGRRLD
jgi:multiple sugar transport system ATP-binding protein